MTQIQRYDDYNEQSNGYDDQASCLYDNAHMVIDSLTRDSDLSSFDCEDELS